MQEQIEQQAAYRQNRTQSIDQTLQSQEAAKRTSGGGNPSDLAAMIAAKAASRKPMAGSPTRKDFPREDMLERLGRSSTMDRNLDGARWVCTWKGRDCVRCGCGLIRRRCGSVYAYCWGNRCTYMCACVCLFRNLVLCANFLMKTFNYI